MQWPAQLLFVLSVSALLAQTPPAIATDPAGDKSHPASSKEMVVPSHGENLYGIFYFAAGDGAHPTVVLLHGFPGYEQNLDLAQAIRRAGWNVLALHYRGSWGVGGDFSLAHSMEDADAMVAFVRSPEAAASYRVDRSHVVVIGHSMGGFMAASAIAHEPAVLGAVMIGTWDLTEPLRGAAKQSRDELIARTLKGNGAEPADFAPLRNYDERKLAAEIVDHRDAWDLNKFAAPIGARPILLLTANDGSDVGSARFEQALKAAGNPHVQRIHTATDHGFNDHRIYLESTILTWLATLIH